MNYDHGNSVKQTADGGFIIGGQAKSFGAGSIDGYLIKTTSNGTLQWEKTYGGTDDDFGYSVLQTNDGGFIISGSTYSFGEGLSDIYLIKTDSIGNSGCHETTPTSTISSAGTQSSGGIEGTGGITNTITSQTGSGGIETTICATGVNEIALEDMICVYPNPSRGKFTVYGLWESIPAGLPTIQIQIYNLLGENVFETTAVTHNNSTRVPSGETINLSGASGVYFLKMKTSERIIVRKIILE